MTFNGEFQKKMMAQEGDYVDFPGGAIDMHLHMVDFTQKTEGLKELLKQMDSANVKKTVIFGLPVKKKWAEYEPLKPGYYLDDNAKCFYWCATDEMVAMEYQKLLPDERACFAPTIAGINSTDMSVDEYLEMIWSKYDFWCGVGEVLLRHDDLTNLTSGETPRGNNRALLKVIDFCYKYKLPVNIHQNVTSVGDSKEYEYLHELEWFMENSKGIDVLWAHCGVSRRLDPENYTEVIENHLKSWNNLYVDLSWVVYDNVICDKAGVVKQEWVDLINMYSDRFMIGSDLVGKFGSLGKTMGRYSQLLNRLNEKAAVKVARDNAEKMWFKRKG